MIDIAAERVERGLKQTELASLAGVHIRTLRRLEKGGAGVSAVMRERVLSAMGLVDAEPSVEPVPSGGISPPDVSRYDAALATVAAKAAEPDMSGYFLPPFVFQYFTVLLIGSLAVTSEFGAVAGAVCMFVVSPIVAGSCLLLGIKLFASRCDSVADECRVVLRGISAGAITVVDAATMRQLRWSSTEEEMRTAFDSPACDLAVLGRSA